MREESGKNQGGIRERERVDSAGTFRQDLGNMKVRIQGT